MKEVNDVIAGAIDKEIRGTALLEPANTPKSQAFRIVGKKVLVIGTESWFGPLLSKHHIVFELCHENEVLYIEPFFHLGWLLHGKLPQRIYHEPYHQLQPTSLTRLAPWRLPKSSTNKTIRRLSERIMQVQMLSKGFHPDIIISFSPYYAFLTSQPNTPFIYYAVDAVETKETIAAELETLSQADLVVAATEELFCRFQGKTRRLRYLSHGVSPEFLNASAMKLPEVVSSINRPRIGFIGAVSQVIDIPLVIELARSRPAYSIVLVGPYEKQNFGGGLTPEAVAHLRAYPNIHLLGPCPSSEVGAYISGFDVGIIPYDLSHPRIHFSYHKVLQYMALGKPVVTTCPASSEILPPDVRVGQTPDTFIDAIDQALEDGIDSAKRCRTFAQSHSWDQKVMQLMCWATGDNK